MNNLLEEKRATLRLLERKADKLSIKIAEVLDLPRLWSYEMVDVDDPAIQDIYNERLTILKKIAIVSDEIARLEHEENNPRKDYPARKVVTHFLNELGDADSISFLLELHMTTHELIEAVANNPHFYDDIFYDDYMSEVIV